MTNDILLFHRFPVYGWDTPLPLVHFLPHLIVPDMTYNVFGGTLSLTQSTIILLKVHMGGN